MDDKIAQLSTMKFFQALSPQEQEALANEVALRHVKKGKIFYYPEDTGDDVFFLKEGTVQLYRISPEGKKLVIHTMNDNSLFGEVSLFDQHTHGIFAEALTDCTIFVIGRTELERLMIAYPGLGIKILQLAGERLRETETQLEALAFKSIPARLASLLLRLARNGDEVTGLTHQDLAEMIGTYRETTTQTLNDMKAEGIVEIGRRRISIMDRDALQAIAEK